MSRRDPLKHTQSKKSISGAEFNAQYSTTKLYKFTNQKHKHHKFQYQEGLNVDHLPFNISRNCCPGGLYFAYGELFFTWIRSNTVWVWDVTIPDDAQVFKEPGFKAKADKIILSNCRPIIEMTEFNNMTRTAKFELSIRYPMLHKVFQIELMEEEAILMISMNKELCRVIPLHSEVVQLAAVQKWHKALYYINNPSDEIIKESIMAFPRSIMFTKKRSDPEIIHFAYMRDPVTLRWAVLTPELQKEYIRLDIQNLEYMRECDNTELHLYALECWGGKALLQLYNAHDHELPEATQLAIVNSNPKLIDMLNFPSLEVQITAVKLDLDTFNYIGIPEPSVEEYYYSQKNNGLTNTIP